jgi:hypothetical protein
VLCAQAQSSGRAANAEQLQAEEQRMQGMAASLQRLQQGTADLLRSCQLQGTGPDAPAAAPGAEHQPRQLSAAQQAVYSGLKVTGRAVKMAASVAESVKRDVERAASEWGEESREVSRGRLAVPRWISC